MAIERRAPSAVLLSLAAGVRVLDALSRSHGMTRRGKRADRSAFAVDSLDRYFLLDALHHLRGIRPH